MESGATISASIRKLMALILRETCFPTKQTLQLVQGDLTTEAVDAIVNAANSQLQHGGGVAGIIVRCGGYEIQAESNAWVREHGPVSHAEPAYTGAGRLPCRYVIHAVGPVWGEGNEDNKLAAAITGSLILADRLGLSSIAFPAISTGIFGFPKERAAGVIFSAIESYFAQLSSSGLQIVRLTLFDQPTVDAFTKVWDAPKP
jgi:O-acetyl-ADP-ribose deacetylase (regulator of RNase III)